MIKTVGKTTYEGEFTSKDGHIICDCGNESFTMNGHMDFTDKAITAYSCDKCRRVITITTIREMPL